MTAGTKAMVAKNRTSLTNERASFPDSTQARISTPLDGGGPAMSSRRALERKRRPLTMNAMPPNLFSPFSSSDMVRPSSAPRLPVNQLEKLGVHHRGNHCGGVPIGLRQIGE